MSGLQMNCNSKSTPRSGAKLNDPEVGAVLDYLGLKRTKANFDHFNPYVDWQAVEENIRKPKKLAVCHLLDGNGKVVNRCGVPLVVFEEVLVEGHEQILLDRSKKFIRWWD